MSLLEFNIDRQFLQSHTMSFKLPATDLKTTNLAQDAMLEFEEEFYYIADLRQQRIKNEIYWAVKANALWYRLGERKRIGNFVMSAVWPSLGLNLIIAEMNEAGLDWAIGNVSSSDTLYSLDVTDVSFLDMLYTWGKICQCEIVFDTKYKLIHFTETIGGNYGLSFRYSRNLTDIERVETPPAVTRLYPYGRLDVSIADVNGGVEYLEDLSYYTNQGLTEEFARDNYTKDYSFQDDAFVDGPSLKASAQNQLSIMAQPQITYTAKVVDLTRITGYEESNFGLGDFVWVEDAPLNISVQARVTRYTRYPYEPFRNEVELAFAPVTLPNPSTPQNRSRNLNWELFPTSNLRTDRTITTARTVLHRLPLIVSQEAEWIMSYSLKAVCISSGTLQIRFDNDFDDTTAFPTFERYVTAGETIDYYYAWTNNHVPINTYQFMVRAEMIDGGEVFIPSDQSHFWVFGRNVTAGTNPVFDNEVTFTVTTLWRVPDDVGEIEIELHGQATSPRIQGDGVWGYGGYVYGKLEVVAGDYWIASFDNNGGNPGFSAGGTGSRGGQSCSFRRNGMAFVDSLLVAAGGGGRGEQSASSPSPEGGNGGFLAGTNGTNSARDGFAAGATQSAGGAGLSAGFDGTFGQGGAGNTSGNFFDFDSGGGGGGWYGGEGGQVGPGGHGTRGGGGGSGWATNEVYDLDYQDAENNGGAFITIRWADPIVPGL